MNTKVNIVIPLVGLIIGGISYWSQPYGELQIIGSNIPLVWSVGAFFGSLLLMSFLNEKPPKIALLISLGVILAVLARIIYDGLFVDSTDHNLAPFEIIICGLITIPSSFVGVYLAILIKKFKK
jgi:hypothetical protein